MRKFAVLVVLAALVWLAAGCRLVTGKEDDAPPQTLALQTLAPGETPRPPQQTAIRQATETETARATRTLRPTSTLRPTATRTPTSTHTPTPTLTPTPRPMVNVLIVTCDTSFDLRNRMGEVTNAYVRIQNVGQVDVTQVQVTLSATDEEGAHPDRSYLVQNLPSGYEIVLKMTVDTQSGQDTSITVTVESREGVREEAEKLSCFLRSPDREAIERLGELFSVRPIRPAP
jgi:hypothetical protein